MVEHELFLGIDIGTTTVKAGLFDVHGSVVAHAAYRYPTHRLGNGVVEQDPNDWVKGIKQVVDKVITGIKGDRVAAVGLCSQVNTDVFVDIAGNALAPAITWQDNRAAAEALSLDRNISDEERQCWWGAPLPVGASHILARMLWMQHHKPDIMSATHRVLTPKDFCLRAFAGVEVADPISNFFIVGANLTYIDGLIERVEGARRRLAPLYSFTDIVGDFELGSSGKRVPVVAGTMDAWSGIFGSGISRAGQGVYMSGTSEILAVTSEQRIGAPGVVTFPTAIGLNVNAGPTQSGGDSIRWWGETVGLDVASVLNLASEADRSDRPILFLPHLEGERAPLWDTDIRGAFIGLDSRTKGPDYALAVMEGVALSARLLLHSLDQAAGSTVPRLFHAGGGAQSDLWAQIRADCLGRTLDRVAFSDVGCLGAAMMASVGVGAHPTLSDAVLSMTKIDRSFEPIHRFKDRYDDMFEAFLNAKDALRPIGKIGKKREFDA